MNTEEGQKRKARLHDCVGEHNVRMIAKYYSRIAFKRMAELLELDEDQMETFVCKLIVNGVIPDAKIDRPAGLITFQPKRSTVDVLDEVGNLFGKY